MTEGNCFHCGDEVIGKPIIYQDHNFCCNGCKGVYQLLSENNLGSFYQLESGAGIRPSSNSSDKYNYLDIENIRNKFIEFEDETCDTALH